MKSPGTAQPPVWPTYLLLMSYTRPCWSAICLPPTPGSGHFPIPGGNDTSQGLLLIACGVADAGSGDRGGVRRPSPQRGWGLTWISSRSVLAHAVSYLRQARTKTLTAASSGAVAPRTFDCSTLTGPLLWHYGPPVPECEVGKGVPLSGPRSRTSGACARRRWRSALPPSDGPSTSPPLPRPPGVRSDACPRGPRGAPTGGRGYSCGPACHAGPSLPREVGGAETVVGMDLADVWDLIDGTEEGDQGEGGDLPRTGNGGEQLGLLGPHELPVNEMWSRFLVVSSRCTRGSSSRSNPGRSSSRRVSRLHLRIMIPSSSGMPFRSRTE